MNYTQLTYEQGCQIGALLKMGHNRAQNLQGGTDLDRDVAKAVQYYLSSDVTICPTSYLIYLFHKPQFHFIGNILDLDPVFSHGLPLTQRARYPGRNPYAGTRSLVTHFDRDMMQAALQFVEIKGTVATVLMDEIFLPVSPLQINNEIVFVP